MCFGGGGGDGGASDRAQARADAEALRVKKAIANVNALFGVPSADYPANGAWANRDARNRIYHGIETAVGDLNRGTLDREFQDAGREVNFDAARRGLYGGSAYADNLDRLNQDRNTGLQKITTAAEAAATAARAADDKTRLNLAGQITNGLDQATALSSARNQLDSNAATARDDAMASGLTGFFNDLLTSLQRNTAQQGLINAATRSGFYGSTPSYNAPAGSIYRG